MLSAKKKYAAQQKNPCWRIPTAVFILVIALRTNLHTVHLGNLLSVPKTSASFLNLKETVGVLQEHGVNTHLLKAIYSLGLTYMTFLGPIPIFPKFLNLVFCFIVKNIIYGILCLFSKTSTIRIWEKIIQIAAISIFLIYLFNLMMMLLFWLQQPKHAPWFILSACLWKRTC